MRWQPDATPETLTTSNCAAICTISSVPSHGMRVIDAFLAKNEFTRSDVGAWFNIISITCLRVCHCMLGLLSGRHASSMHAIIHHHLWHPAATVGGRRPARAGGRPALIRAAAIYRHICSLSLKSPRKIANTCVSSRPPAALAIDMHAWIDCMCHAKQMEVRGVTRARPEYRGGALGLHAWMTDQIVREVRCLVHELESAQGF